MPRKFTRLFRELPSDQQKRFQRWLQMELHGQTARIGQLLDLHLQGDSEAVIWKKLFPLKPEAEGSRVLGRLFGDLTERLEEYLAIQAFRQDDLAKNRRLLEVYNRLDQPDDFQKTWRKILRRLERQPQREERFYRIRFELELEKAAHLLKHPGRKEELAQTGPSRQAWFIQSWLHTWMRRYVLRRNGQAAPLGIAPEVDTWLLQESRRIGEQLEDPVLLLWHRLATLKLNIRDFLPAQVPGILADMEGLMIQFRQAAKQFAQDQSFDFYAQVSNLLLSLKRAGVSDKIILPLQLRWLDWALEGGWMLIEGQLPGIAYTNYTTQAIRMGNYLPEAQRARHFEKVRNQLATHRKELPLQEQASRWNFHRLQVLFAEGNFQEFSRIYGLLQQQAFPWPSPRNEVEIRLMELHVRLHLQEGLYYFPAAEKSLREFCHRQSTIPKDHKLLFKCHFRYLRKFFRIKDPAQYRLLYQQIEQEKMAYRDALLQLVSKYQTP